MGGEGEVEGGHDGRMAEEKYRTLVLDSFVPQLSRMR